MRMPFANYERQIDTTIITTINVKRKNPDIIDAYVAIANSTGFLYFLFGSKYRYYSTNLLFNTHSFIILTWVVPVRGYPPL